MKNNYNVIHLHDDTSNANGYADSCTKFNEYVDLAVRDDMKAIAFSNHGGIYDWIKKKQYCDKKGIKYIHGVELYLCINLEDNNRGYHIGLYAKNLDGVKELNSLMSKATSKGVRSDNKDRHYYFNPRISFEELMNTSDNIIITTACLASALWKLSNKSILEEDPDKYIYNIKKRNKLLEWLGKNRHRCFLEIQYHNCKHQKEYNKMLYEWNKEYGIPLIAGTDTHSSNKYKAECRKILQKSKDSFYGEEDEFDLTWKTYDELIKCFKIQDSIPMDIVMEAIDNTNKFADMIEPFDLNKEFKYPNLYGKDAKKLWWDYIVQKYKYKKENKIIDINRLEDYKEKIKEEYESMTKQGMESFMLFMAELSDYCQENDINFSPCRGSVGGSLVAYITDITDVDPIKWKTVFSRFCNADRISLADIDMDFSPKDRKKVYDYIINRFGNDKVSYILTLGTIKDRGSIDVLAKGLDYHDLGLVKSIKNNFDEYFNEFSKVIQEEVNLEELEGATSSSPTFDDCELYCKVIKKQDKIKKIKELKQKWDNLRLDNEELFYYFDGIKGTIISKGNHPAGMIGSPITLYDNLGVFYKGGDENFPVSFCSMKAVDSLNYVKFDILGLKTIGVLQDTYKLLNKKWEKSHEIDWNDENVWNDMITCNAGVFQFEGDYAFELLSQFKPRAINDMSLVNASLRPSGKSYRDRLINREFNNNPSEEIDELLKDNNGFLVFQEDTIKFLTEICGFSDSLADTTRRAIGKKDEELLKEQLPKILEGYCVKSPKEREVAEEEAKEFIQIVSDSSEYQFGLNHSTGYSMNGYRCARERYYNPLEFTTAYLNNAENEEDMINGMKIAKIKNIEIKSPKFRYSKGEYFFDRDSNSIYKGVGSIKYLNINIGDELYGLRDNEYNNFIDLLKDMDKISINSNQLEILIKIDYFKEFGNPNQILEMVKIFNQWNGRKQIDKNKIIELGLNVDEIAKFGNETPKQINKLDSNAVMNSLLLEINIKTSIRDRLIYEHECLGYCTCKYPKHKDKAIVLEIDTKNAPKIYTYKLSGEEIMYKAYKKTFNKNQFQKYDIIQIGSTTPKPKTKKVGDEWVEIGGEDIWLNGWKVIN